MALGAGHPDRSGNIRGPVPVDVADDTVFDEMSLPLYMPQVPSDVLAKIRASGRDVQRMVVSWKIRMNHMHLRVLDKGWKRTELAWRVQGQYTKDFGNWLDGVLQDNPRFFEDFQLVPESTVSKDNRVLEELGFFEKGQSQ